MDGWIARASDRTLVVEGGKKSAVSYVEELDLVREEPHLPLPSPALIPPPPSCPGGCCPPATCHVFSPWVDLDAAKYNVETWRSGSFGEVSPCITVTPDIRNDDDDDYYSLRGTAAAEGCRFDCRSNDRPSLPAFHLNVTGKREAFLPLHLIPALPEIKGEQPLPSHPTPHQTRARTHAQSSSREWD